MIDIRAKKSFTLDNLKKSLAEAINFLGGLKLDDKTEPVGATEELEADVPKSEFIGSPQENDDSVDTNNNISLVSPELLFLAFSKDKASPYDNEWIEIKDDKTLTEVPINDNDILAFRYENDLNFDIVDPAYES